MERSTTHTAWQMPALVRPLAQIEAQRGHLCQACHFDLNVDTLQALNVEQLLHLAAALRDDDTVIGKLSADHQHAFYLQS